MPYTTLRKGVLVRGLRGGCVPSTSPDLGHANVGMRARGSESGLDACAVEAGAALLERLVSAGYLRGRCPFFHIFGYRGTGAGSVRFAAFVKPL